MNVSMYSPNLQTGSKVFVPVSQNLVMYSHFEHVSGYPAKSDDGISIDRAFLLNSLISNLIKLGKRESQIAAEFSGSADEKIVQMQGEVARLAKIEPATPYSAVSLPQAGEAFSFTA